MQLIALENVRHYVQVGMPLPFNVRQSDGKLLLARGQVIDTAEQLETLLERGTLIDIGEVESPRERIMRATPAELPALWSRAIDRAGETLQALPADGLDSAMDEVAQPLVALTERDPDLAIFQVLRQHGNHHTQYGVNHSIHCAIAAFLAGHRLGLDSATLTLAFKAALTMNVSMLELQGQLATQIGPLTPAQREAIQGHPERSVQMLKVAGITDPEWLEAVAQHHETSDGTGYPLGLRDVAPLAQLLNRCDVYTAKLSPRRSREGLTADVAVRRMFAARPDDPITAALIKEFGLYPPGSFVRLEGGETAIVVRRGSNAHTPLVSVLTDARGAALARPQRRDTAQHGNRIVSMLNGSTTPLPLAPEALLATL
jgi:hypothetical protein